MLDESAKKKKEVIKNARKILEEINREEDHRLRTVFKEILEDPYYKENMLYYFKQFLSEKY